MQYIKQYGLERTGTNYVRRLIELNCHARVLAHVVYSKHCLPWPLNRDNYRSWRITQDSVYDGVVSSEFFSAVHEADEFLAAIDEVKYLLNVKNPYSWIDSWRRYYNNTHPVQYAVSVWNEWCRAAQAFIGFYSDRTIIVRYEDILSDMPGTLDRIIQKLHLFRSAENLVDDRNIIYSGYVFSADPFHRCYYDDKLYLKAFTVKQLRIINSHLNKDMMEFLGYTYENNLD